MQASPRMRDDQSHLYLLQLDSTKAEMQQQIAALRSEKESAIQEVLMPHQEHSCKVLLLSQTCTPHARHLPHIIIVQVGEMMGCLRGPHCSW